MSSSKLTVEETPWRINIQIERKIKQFRKSSFILLTCKPTIGQIYISTSRQQLAWNVNIKNITDWEQFRQLEQHEGFKHINNIKKKQRWRIFVNEQIRNESNDGCINKIKAWNVKRRDKIELSCITTNKQNNAKLKYYIMHKYSCCMMMAYWYLLLIFKWDASINTIN